MRENRGSEIVKELIGKDVPTILDPVFMFNKEEWAYLIPQERIINEPYLFTYFLGANREYRDAVTKAAKALKCKIVVLRHMDQFILEDEDFGDVALYDIGPDKFLNLLRNASYVCTDSFHGACFSIINQKQFVIFNRYSENSKYSKNSRIDTLCQNLNLSERRYNDEITLDKQLSKEINYKNVQSKLDVLKKSTSDYLDTALLGVD